MLSFMCIQYMSMLDFKKKAAKHYLLLNLKSRSKSSGAGLAFNMLPCNDQMICQVKKQLHCALILWLNQTVVTNDSRFARLCAWCTLHAVEKWCG